MVVIWTGTACPMSLRSAAARTTWFGIVRRNGERAKSRGDSESCDLESMMGYPTQKRLRWLALGAIVYIFIALAACWANFQKRWAGTFGATGRHGAPVLVLEGDDHRRGSHAQGARAFAGVCRRGLRTALILIDSGKDGDAGRFEVSDEPELGLDWRRIRRSLDQAHVHMQRSQLGGAGAASGPRPSERRYLTVVPVTRTSSGARRTS